MHRDMGQSSLAESLLPETLGNNERLERIDDAVEWGRFGRLVAGVYSACEGRPSYPPLTMVKVLLLEQWYNLSDPQMEEALGDRISFRRFVGLGLQDDTPDHSTISRFRAMLTERGVVEGLMEELNRQLEEKGMMVKAGTLMDATLVESQGRRVSKKEEATDKDAAWARKGGRNYYGYKVHVGVDDGSGLIRKAVLTPANLNDTEVADELIMGDEGAVYADRAYDTHERRQKLKSMGIGDRIMKRGNKHHPEVSEEDMERNELISRVRSRVEKVFGTLKRTYGYSRVRYIGLERNATEMWLKCMAYNLRRADRIVLNGT